MSLRKEIFEEFKSKSCVKQEAFAQTVVCFGLVKEVLIGIANDYEKYLKTIDNRVLINYEDKGPYGAVLSFGGDVLVFQMQTNVFSFKDSNPIHKHSYIKEKESRVFCGVINLYNFLADSFKFNRVNDRGFLISRIFVNEESHLFVEGRQELGYKFSDFAEQVVSKELLTEVIESSIKYTLGFDLNTPDFTSSKVVTVAQMKALSKDQKFTTSKILGFQMKGESDIN